MPHTQRATQVDSSQLKSAQVNSSQLKSTQVNSSQLNSSQVRSSLARSLARSLSCRLCALALAGCALPILRSVAPGWRAGALCNINRPFSGSARSSRRRSHTLLLVSGRALSLTLSLHSPLLAGTVASHHDQPFDARRIARTTPRGWPPS